MPESLLSRRLKLGTFLGIGLYVHWTFSLVIMFVALSSLGSGLVGIAFSIGQLFGIFLCVTLHEYGHAMAARQFGITTADITLLPIGGVARLRRMPRIPWQELVVAVAGPAVNVVIATLLLLGFLILTDGSVLWAVGSYLIAGIMGTPVSDAIHSIIFDIFTLPSVVGYFVVMLIVNIMLVVFNMIPAFPMDGGRVFRSLLAMIMDYRKATMIASRVGLACAALMALVALSADPPHPIPVLIAVFIGYAGIAEARHVEVMESVRGLRAGQVMLRSDLSLSMDTPLAEIANRWQSVAANGLPVVSSTGIVIGMLELQEVVDAVAADKDPMTTAGQLVDHGSWTGTVRVDEELESALLRTGRQRRQIPVVDSAGQLAGILDLDSMLVRGKLLKYVESAPYDLVESPEGEHFDATS